jgi:hypothetical protein
MRKMIALLVSSAFLLGTTGFAVAQTTTTPPAEKKSEDKMMEKKPAKKAMTLEDKKASCLDKAGTDDKKKDKCEKDYTTAKAKMEKKAEKKEMKKEMKEEKKEEKK